MIHIREGKPVLIILIVGVLMLASAVGAMQSWAEDAEGKSEVKANIEALLRAIGSGKVATVAKSCGGDYWYPTTYYWKYIGVSGCYAHYEWTKKTCKCWCYKLCNPFPSGCQGPPLCGQCSETYAGKNKRELLWFCS